MSEEPGGYRSHVNRLGKSFKSVQMDIVTLEVSNEMANCTLQNIGGGGRCLGIGRDSDSQSSACFTSENSSSGKVAGYLNGPARVPLYPQVSEGISQNEKDNLR